LFRRTEHKSANFSIFPIFGDFLFLWAEFRFDRTARLRNLDTQQHQDRTVIRQRIQQLNADKAI